MDRKEVLIKGMEISLYVSNLLVYRYKVNCGKTIIQNLLIPWEIQIINPNNWMNYAFNSHTKWKWVDIIMCVCNLMDTN